MPKQIFTALFLKSIENYRYIDLVYQEEKSLGYLRVLLKTRKFSLDKEGYNFISTGNYDLE